MPRSSRHKSSHKQHKHSSKDFKDYSDSEEEESMKERKVREESTVSSGIRVSRDSEEKRKSSQGKDLSVSGNGDLSADYGSSKKWKDTDRWNGGDLGRSEFGRESKGEISGPDLDREPKLKVSVDSKNRSSKRYESLSERKDESSALWVENEDSNRASMKVDSSRKEVHQYKDGKERGIDLDKKAHEVRRESSVDIMTVEVSRKQERQFEEEHVVKQEVENTDDLRNPELDKELEKRVRRRRDGSGDKDKRPEDDRDSNDKRSLRDGDDRRSLREGDNWRSSSLKDDRLKNGIYKDDGHKDVRYKDERYKYPEDFDRNNRIKDTKHRDERSSRDRISEKSDNKHLRDESKISETSYKRSKLQDNDRDVSPYGDDRGAKYKDNKRRTRYSDDIEDHSDLKSRNTKEQCTEMEKNVVNSKLDSVSGRGRSDLHYCQSDAASTPSSSQLKRSPASTSHVVKDQYRRGSKQAESARRESLSEERRRPNTSSTGELGSAFLVPERVSESLSVEKPKKKDDSHLGELSAENVATSHYERSPLSGRLASPTQLSEKSPSSTSGDRRYSNRAGLRSLDVEEMGQRSGGSRDARDYATSEETGREFPLEKPVADEFSQAAAVNSDSTPVGSSFNRSGNFPGSTPSLLPPTPFRFGIDSPSVLGSSEEDVRGQAGDRKSNNRYKRNGDPNTGRGHGNTWKGIPNWPSPVGNGFIPFQHGPPPSGFHAVVQQFPAPVFGIRPSMEMNPAGVPYHMHDADRVSGHGRSFGWQNPSDDSCPPQLHEWDGNSGVFGDESHIYGRPDWDQNRHLMGSRGWEMNELWKGQNGSLNVEYPASQKEQDHLAQAPADEAWAGQSTHRSRSERNRPNRLPPESIEIKRSHVTNPATKSNVEAPPKVDSEKISEPSKLSSHDSFRICRVYLSKLDISEDLASTELCNRCMSLLEVDENKTADHNVTKHVYTEEREVNMKGSLGSLGASLFAAASEAVFQKAMSLYKKQQEEMKSKIPVPSFFGWEQEKAAAASNLEKATPASEEEKAADIIESAKHDVDASTPPSYQEGENSSGNSKGNVSADVKSDIIAGDVGFPYGSSESCEALMPESIECRVNLSRIHPENTH